MLASLSAKIAFRNLPRRRARTVLTVTAVVLGVALLVGINMATASAMGEFTSYINKFWGQTDLIVRYPRPVPFGSAPFEVGNLSLLRPGGEIQQTAVRINWAGSFAPPNNQTIFQLVGVNRTDFDFASFNITGTKTLDYHQAIVSNTLAEKFGLAIGSTTTLLTFSFPFSQNSAIVTISLTIVGIDHPLRNLGSNVYMFLPELQKKVGLDGLITHIYATIDNPANALRVREEVQGRLPLFDVSAPKAEAVQRITGQMAGFQLGLNVMVAVALVVCTFIVFNTLFMAVNERTYEIGVMRAVGTSRRQVFRVFLGEGLLIGVIGALLGVVAGFGLSRLFTTVAEKYLEIPSLPETQLTPAVILVGFSAGLVTVVAGALYPALAASRIDIIRAIRPRARDRQRRVPDPIVGLVSAGMLVLGGLQAYRLTPFHIPYMDVVLVPLGLVTLGAVVYGRAGEYLARPFQFVSGGVGSVASKSGRRRLVRNAVSFGMITVTLSFVILLGGIQAGVQISIEQGLREALGADIFLVANQSIPISFTSNLTRIAGVSVATPFGPSPLPSKAFGPRGNASIGVLAVDPSQFPRIIAYNFVNSLAPGQEYSQLGTGNETLLMPDGLAGRLGVAAGERVSIETSNGTVPFMVAGVFTGPILQYLRFGESFASESIIVSFASQQRYFAGKMEAPIFLVDLKPEVKSRASTIAHDIAAAYPKYDLAENSVTLSELLALVRSTIDRIFAVILLILYFALLIAILGIGATMIMNITDRRREIGLLRSQGASRGQVASLFLGEGVTLGIFGFVLAVPGGLLLLRGATNSTSIAGFWLPYIIPWSAIVQSFMLAIVAVVVGSVYPAIRASRMQVTKALEQV